MKARPIRVGHPRMPPERKRLGAGRAGFTLVELMVVLAIAAVVAAFAVPSYRHHVERGHRLGAVAGLYRAAQYVETFGDGLPATLPDGLDRVPGQGAPAYRLRLRTTGDARGGYALDASPSSDGAMRGDACGTYVLHADGTHENIAAADSDPMAQPCWPAH